MPYERRSVRDLADLFDSPRWLCFNVDPSSDTAHFVLLERDDYKTERFHSIHELEAAFARRGSTPPMIEVSLNELLDATPPELPPTRKLHYAYFYPYSGSTLLTHCLGRLDHCLVTSEPNLFDYLSKIKRFWFDSIGSVERWHTLVRACAVLLSRTYSAAETALVKVSDDVTSIMEDLLDATPRCRTILIYSDFRSFFAQTYKVESRRRRITARLRSALVDPRGARWGTPDLALELSTPQVIAAFWLQLIHGFLDGIRGRPYRVVDANAFLADPSRILGELAAFFAIPTSPDEIRHVVASDAFRTSTKTEGRPFTPDDRRREIDRVLHDARSEFAEATRWLEEASRTHPVPDPIPGWLS